MRKKRFCLGVGIFVMIVASVVMMAATAYLEFLRNLPKVFFWGDGDADSEEWVLAEDFGEEASEEEWCLILVNQEHFVPEDYEVDLVELSNGQCVDRRIYPALQEMFDVARGEGIYPVVASGYRTAQKQQSLMDEKIIAYMAKGCSVQEAKKKAEIWVAAVGTSEHQLGICVDINADGVHSAGNEVYEWLDENGYRFGFIKRYPEDKTEITGIRNEPWHYRYVGRKAAAEIYHRGVCLEEYLEDRG